MLLIPKKLSAYNIETVLLYKPTWLISYKYCLHERMTLEKPLSIEAKPMLTVVFKG